MEWTYLGKPFEDPGDNYGYVYRITNLVNDKQYIGRKYFTLAATKQVKGKKKKYRKESDWKTYFGSSKDLLEDVEKYGPEKFKREILRLCKNRTECSYYESRYILMEDALLRDDYYNRWISCKITEIHLKSIKKRI